jgi:hypothetical protein
MKQLLKFFSVLIYSVHESNKFLHATEKLVCLRGISSLCNDSLHAFERVSVK